MAINPEIRDHAYQFFTEEAPELLQILEAGLLTLNQRNTATVHNLMRAAHSLKGGAASVGLDAIATLAHRLENILKALYSDSLEVDTGLENDLLQAYDCLRLPLMEQITTGQFNPDALAIADPIFTQIEIRCGDALLQAETYLPSSAELGMDMITSIFEVDVVQGLDRLTAVLAHPEEYEVAGELRAQIEVFIGFAELLSLPEFKTIAETAQQALNAHPDRALEITALTLVDLERSRQAVLMGDRATGLEPSAALTALALDATASTAPISTLEMNALEMNALGMDTLGMDTLEMDALEMNTLGMDALEMDALEMDALEIDALEMDSLGMDTLEMDSLGMDTLGMDSLGMDTASIDAPIAANTEVDTVPFQVALPQLENLFGVFGGAFTAAESAFSQDDALEDAELPMVDSFAIDPDEALEATGFPLMDSLDHASLDHTSLDTASLDAAIAADPAAIAADPAAIDSGAIDSGAIGSEVTDDTHELDAAALDRMAADVIDAEWVAAQPAPAQPLTNAGSLVPSTFSQSGALQLNPVAHQSTRRQRNESVSFRQGEAVASPNLTVRVDADRLERMSNLVGELTINRNGLSLQNEQLQSVLRELLKRFAHFEDMVGHLRESLDQMLVAPERQNYASVSTNPSVTAPPLAKNGGQNAPPDFRPFSATNYAASSPTAAEFDSLEMDSYGVLHAQLQEILENFVQLDETVDDVTLYARQSDRLLDQQRHMLTNLTSELTQARMLPLGEVLNRFPRVLRDLSATYHKPVNLKLTGTSLLVDRAILDKLYDPLLHLLRNAFDHGIEASHVRSQLGKPAEGQIEIRAYYKGNQTIIEIKDDGQGLNLDRIRSRAFELGWFSADQLLTTPPARLFELIFEPGFSTAQQVSELSGRGIGLDVVRSQLQLIKGTVAVASSPRQGTTFTLRLPLTLTNTKLIICTVGTTTLALPVDSVEEILTPQPNQTRQSGTQRFLYWREQIIPAYRLADLLDYACPLPEVPVGKTPSTLASPKTTTLPMLVLHQQEQLFAIEVDQLVTEQELVIKSFGALIDPPSYLYGCTSLGDGSLIPVIDSSALLAFEREATEMSAIERASRSVDRHNQSSTRKPAAVIQTVQTTTILVVDDAVTLRRTLALSLERAGYRVLQARDGREAIDQCQHATVHLVICDIEMPNMNGFEFLSYRRQDPQISQIPIMMLTSRSNEKHRWLAMQLGATAYFTKPYLEQEFLAAINALFKDR